MHEPFAGHGGNDVHHLIEGVGVANVVASGKLIDVAPQVLRAQSETLPAGTYRLASLLVGAAVAVGALTVLVLALFFFF